jgi:hypothetical protein
LHTATTLLQTSKHSALEAIKSNDLQVSGLVNACGAVQVDIILIKILNELFSLTLSPCNANQLAFMATQLRSNFWMLRVEEIIYALNKGINGGYGKVFGHLNYIQIADWLNEYDAERTLAIQQMNDKSAGESKVLLKDWKVDLTLLIEKFPMKAEEKKQMTEEDYERANLTNLQTFAHTFTDQQLQDLKTLAITQNRQRVLNFIVGVLAQRANPKTG